MYRTIVPTVVTNGHFDKGKSLEQLCRCHADGVVLVIKRELEYGFSSPDNLTLLKELIAYYRENGLETIVWFGETLGHNGAFPDGKVPEDSPYQHICHISGERVNAFCPLDENLKRDFSRWVRKVAACGADIMLLDDDFRVGVRGHGTGCCCRMHMERLKACLGEEITEEELKGKIFEGGPSRYRDAWQRVQREALEEFALALRSALDEERRGVRLGLCSNPDWDMNCDTVRLTKLLAGDTRPFLRLNGAPYWARSGIGMSLGQVAETERMEASWCRCEDFDIVSEGDTYPRPRTAVPASFLECFDTILRADGSTGGILKYMLDEVSDADYETGYVDAMAANEPLYREISRIFDGKKSIGVRPCHPRERFRFAEMGEYNDSRISEYEWNVQRQSISLAVACSLPSAYEEGDFVNIALGDDGIHLTQEELECGSILDLPAAMFLTERGIDVGIGGSRPALFCSGAGFADVPWEYFIEEDLYVRLDPGVALTEIIHKPGATVLSRFCQGGKDILGAYSYCNALGMHFLVLPFAAAEVFRGGRIDSVHGWLDSYARRRQLIRWMAGMGRPLLAYCDGNHPCLYTLVKQGEDGVSIGLWNLYPDAIRNAHICLNFDFTAAEFVNCRGHREGGGIVLDTVLYPHEFAGVECRYCGREERKLLAHSHFAHLEVGC